jgi:hypothetical protein
MKGIRKLLIWIALLVLLTWPGGAAGAEGVREPAAPAAEEVVARIRQSCSGYGGPYPCYTSLAAWGADCGGITGGDLVTTDKIAVARIEGTWTQADTTPVSLSGWTTDAEHYIRIYTTAEARHKGTPGSGYRLVTSGGGISILESYVRIEGLEVNSLTIPVYARPGSGLDGDIRLSHNLIHGNGTTTESGIYIYDYAGTARIWNNIIYDVGTPGWEGGIHASGSALYVYNNTIVDVITGYAIRNDGTMVVKNNLTEAPNSDYFGAFYPGSDFNASSDDTAPGFHSRRDQTFTFVNRAGDNFRLASTDGGARNYGTDLSSDLYIPITDDVDSDTRAGGWDIGADEAQSGLDTIPPVRFDGAPSGTLPSYTTEVTLTLSTSEAATCRYAITPGVAYASMTHTFSFTGGITHTHHVSGLVDEQTYTTYVRCQDTASNANDDDYEISFYIFSSDTTPPIISDVQVVDITPYSAHITWETDEPCTSQVEHGITDGYGTVSPISSTLVTSHSMTLLGLDASTTYHVRARSQDVAYNETISDDVTFVTADLGDFHYVNQSHPSARDTNPGTIDLPWLTIQHAADVSQPGDTVIVYPGSYGRVWIDHGGAPGNYVTFKGLNVPDQSLVDPDVLFDPHNPVRIPGNETVNAVTMGFVLWDQPPDAEPVAYVRIESFEITNISAEGSIFPSAVYMAGTTAHVEIVNNFLHDVNPAANGYGIQSVTHDSTDVVVRGNTLYRVQGVGINIVGCNWIVDGNELSHGLDVNTITGEYDSTDGDAMRFFGSGHVIRNNNMHDYLDVEQLTDPHMDCFEVFSVYPEGQFAHDILIEGNICDNFGQILQIQDDSQVAGTGDAVHHITFRNNVFIRARASGINGGNAEHLTFVNNVVAECHYTGFGVFNSPYMTFVNNILYNNGSGSQIGDEETKIGSVWDYNVYYPDFSWPPKQPAFDQHSLFGVDPGFVDPAADDYRLWFDSPAVDAGATLYEFNYDADGVIRPQGAGWDIGPHEFDPSLALRGTGGNRIIYLDWTANVSLPVTSTWQMSYYTTTAASVVVDTATLTNTARAYTLTDLENGRWYTVTLSTVGVAPPLSDTVAVRLMERFVYLPLVMRED